MTLEEGSEALALAENLFPIRFFLCVLCGSTGSQPEEITPETRAMLSRISPKGRGASWVRR